jgi:hypothetical protein
MQIVIDIPEKEWTRWIIDGEIDAIVLRNSLINGTPLPKEHGRLIDADRLRSMYSINRANFNTVVGIQKWVDNAPTVIEADKEESEYNQLRKEMRWEHDN